MSLNRYACLALLLTPMVAGAAQSRPEFRLPLDCQVGEDCWVVNYVDWNPSEAAEDYQCGRLTYDGHQGTDFAIRDLLAVRVGVPVLAAADGVVLRSRNGETDSFSEASRARSREEGRECGNGVVIDHGNGWITQYCHMGRGSIVVKSGQPVSAGEEIGRVGTSGFTEFPHLHFQVTHDKQLVDPFTGSRPEGSCGQGADHTLWAEEWLAGLRYQPGQIFNAGFAAGQPDLGRVRQGGYRQRRLRCDSPALVAWMEVFGSRAGDTFRMRLTSPSGELLVSQEKVLEKSQSRIFRYSGKRLRQACWPTGEYLAEFEMIDGNDPRIILSRMELKLRMDPAPASNLPD